jgi:hypothetical protein
VPQPPLELLHQLQGTVHVNFQVTDDAYSVVYFFSKRLLIFLYMVSKILIHATEGVQNAMLCYFP